MSNYRFKGYDFTELALCWNINLEPTFPDWLKNISPDNAGFPETIDIEFRINETSMTFTTEDKEEVIAEKIKRYIRDNLDYSTGRFKDKQIRTDLNNFLIALINESKSELGEFGNYSYPVYEGILKIESDYTFSKWFINNLEEFWS